MAGPRLGTKIDQRSTLERFRVQLRGDLAGKLGARVAFGAPGDPPMEPCWAASVFMSALVSMSAEIRQKTWFFPMTLRQKT